VWPLGLQTGRIGRGVAPQPVTARGVAGVPIANVEVWQVEGQASEHPALAVLGDRDRATVELFDIDEGRAVWRTTCDGSVIGPVGGSVLCRGDAAISALALADGKPAWKHAGRFARREGGHVALFDGDGITVLDATSGAELGHEALPAGDTFAGSCDGEVYATTPRHDLVRLGAVKWTTSLVAERLECSGDAVIVEAGGSLVAVTRFLGKQLGRIDNVRDVWPAVEKAESVFQTTLQNGNPVIHPAVTLLNAALLERTGGDFLFYEEGVTESVGRLIEAVDRERVAIARALGVTILSEPALGVRHGYMLEENYSTGYSTAPGFLGIAAQSQLDHRYLTEDVGYSLTFLSDLATRLSVPTPVMDAVITIASVVLARDFRAEAVRTVTTLGLDGLSPQQLAAL